jgi:hypothetical protein
VVSALGFLLVLALLVTLFGVDSDFFEALLALIVVAVSLSESKRVQDARARWEVTIEDWQRLFYCPRCDRVFDPQTGRSAPSGQMQALL